jgi:hypothetical protein
VTFARLLATGSGRLAWRLEIEGFRYQPVSSRFMEKTTSDFQERICALSFEGVKLTQKANLVTATVEATGATFKMPDIGKRITAGFNTAPTATTWLAADASSSDTTLTVKSTEGFAGAADAEEDRYLYLDSEVIKYGAKTATTFTGCSRGRWGTLAQAHYIPGGAFLRYPEITDQPTVLEGRRVRLYAYGPGDDPQGDGTQVWLGTVRGDLRMQGPTWSVNVEPISRMLEAELGGDLGEPCGLRGIYYPHGLAEARWQITLYRVAYDAGATDTFITDGAAAIAGVVFLPTAAGGFFETQEDFVAAVNTQLDAITSGWNTRVYCRVSADGGYYFVCQPNATPDVVGITFDLPDCDPIFGEFAWDATLNESGWDDEHVGPITANTPYYFHPMRLPMAGAGLVPRGVFGRASSLEADDALAAATHPPARLHLGGVDGITSNTTLAIVSWDTGTDLPYSIQARSSANRSVDLLRLFTPARDAASDLHYYTPGAMPRVRLGRSYGSTAYDGTGTYNLIKSLADSAAVQVNLGSQPMVRTGDFNGTDWLAAYDGATAAARDRIYTSLEPVKLGELISPDLQLLGYFLAFDTDGALVPRRLRLAAPTEIAVYSITRSNLITDKGMPAYERGVVGIYNTLAIRDGYDAQEDRYTLPPIRTRDVASYGRSPISRTVMIEPKSSSRTPITYDSAVRIANGILGIFGNPYAYITCQVPLTAFVAAPLGSTVSITTKQLPSSSGTRGVEDLVALVIGREIDFMAARITLTLLATTANIAGYAPSAKVASQTGATDDWTLTLSSAYFTTDEDASDHIAVGDRVEVYRFDSATAGTQGGEVISVSGNDVRVQFDANWTPGSDEWVLTGAAADNGTALEAGQRRYAYLADADGLIDFGDGFAPARQLAP